MLDNFNQQAMWDRQHKIRSKESREIAGVPNEFAKNCLRYIPEGGFVLEVGAANGRDARFFAREKKCKVVAVDFSLTAIEDLLEESKRDGTNKNVFPLWRDANDSVDLPTDFDVFYSRSALHLNDQNLISFLNYVNERMRVGGYFMIEGKTKDDSKILKSESVDNGLYLDSDGHLRRAWSKEDFDKIAECLI